MTLDIATLRRTLAKKGYVWYEDKPNIIGIRSSLNVPDIFNDILAIVYKDKGVEKLYTTTITTEPGVAYQKKLLNPKGCWVMMPAQMVDAYSPGFHQNKPDHRCLRSTGKIFGLRDNDLNGVAGDDKDAKAEWVNGTSVGANIHGANKAGITKQVGPWSAGCQVHNDWKKKEEMMDICEKLYPTVKKFTYTLVEENDLKS
jgi:hypothetical protein